MSGSRDNYITPAESDCLAQIECERTTAKQVSPSFFKSNYLLLEFICGNRFDELPAACQQ